MIQRVLACVSLSVVTCCALGCATPGATHPGTGATRSSAADLDPKERFLRRVQAEWGTGIPDHVSITEFERLFGPSTVDFTGASDTSYTYGVFLLKPGQIIVAEFRSTDEGQARLRRYIDETREKYDKKELTSASYLDLMRYLSDLRAALLDFERRCRQDGLRPYYSLPNAVTVVQADSYLRQRAVTDGGEALAACERGPIEAWKFLLQRWAEDYAMRGRFGPAAQLFERLAEAEGDREQAFWKAAVAHVAAGNVQGAKTNLARFREAATAEQLTEADAAIRELEAKIATIDAPPK